MSVPLSSSAPLSYVASLDASINEARLKEFGELMLAQGDSTYKLNSDEIIRTTDNNTYAGYGIKDIVELDNLFTKHIQKYLDETNKLIMMNDVLISNEYLNDTMTTEYNRVAKLSDRTRNTIYKTRASYMQKKYSIAYNNFVSGILQFTLFVFILCAICYAVWQQGVDEQLVAFWRAPLLLGGVAMILVVLYLFIVILLYKQYQTRRKDDWDKYYFSSMEKK